MKKGFIVVFTILAISTFAQQDRWQQKVEYKMSIDFDVKKHQFNGVQELTYFNNSPDTLYKAYYHLYFNAFQPNSMMDVRSRTIKDPDKRVGDRISELKPEEQGFQQINSLLQDGKETKYTVEGTILEVELAEPILPNSTAVFQMNFLGQVPQQIRRSGRNNAEGVAYSMTQWYPKMAEYDVDGWHPNPYIGREFYGIWGSFDVTISIDSSFLIAGTGYLQNAEDIGKGYLPDGEEAIQKVDDRGKLTWHFYAPNVHDFAWAADPDYMHDVVQVPDGPTLHFVYKSDVNIENWKALQPKTVKAIQYINKHFGKYPFEQFSVIQGGDGGMEYPMATLIVGKDGSLPGLISVTVHEMLHNWYQGVLATNESLYPWMDEGFTSYAQDRTLNHLKEEPKDDPLGPTIGRFIRIQNALDLEPLTVHADHYMMNQAYGINSYIKGAVFLHQLNYIIGDKAFDKVMLTYFDKWKFKHPNGYDFLRIAERESGMVLDWYYEYMVNTTHKIDYAVKSVEKESRKTSKVTLERLGNFPMPIDLAVTYEDGTVEMYTIPLRIMRGEKQEEGLTVLEDWPWVNTEYSFVLPVKVKEIVKIEIDPKGYMADVNRDNNIYTTEEKEE